MQELDAIHCTRGTKSSFMKKLSSRGYVEVFLYPNNFIYQSPVLTNVNVIIKSFSVLGEFPVPGFGFHLYWTPDDSISYCDNRLIWLEHCIYSNWVGNPTPTTLFDFPGTLPVCILLHLKSVNSEDF